MVVLSSPASQQNGGTWEGLIAAQHASQCCTYHEPSACQGATAEPGAVQDVWIPALQHEPSSSRCLGASLLLQTPSQQFLLLCSVLLAASSRFGKLGGDAASQMQPNWWNSGNPPITHTELSPSTGTLGAVRDLGKASMSLPAHTGIGESSTLLLTHWLSTDLPQPDAASTESFKPQAPAQPFAGCNSTAFP